MANVVGTGVQRPTLLDGVTLFAVAALWGASFLFIRVAVHDLGPVALIEARSCWPAWRCSPWGHYCGASLRGGATGRAIWFSAGQGPGKVVFQQVSSHLTVVEGLRA